MLLFLHFVVAKEATEEKDISTLVAIVVGFVTGIIGWFLIPPLFCFGICYFISRKIIEYIYPLALIAFAGGIIGTFCIIFIILFIFMVLIITTKKK